MADIYISDIHGEYEAFSHVLRSACGLTRKKIDELFSDYLDEDRRATLAELVYYPRRKYAEVEPVVASQAIMQMHLLLDEIGEEDEEGNTAAERVAIPAGAAKPGANPADVEAALVALATAIQHTMVQHVYMLGDVYDRGPSPELIMDELMELPQVDVIWGNHDMLWMGASLGQPGCVATVVRICARYCNLSILRENYGIDLSSIENFAREVYGADPCVGFGVKNASTVSEEEAALSQKVQKAISYIQFKVDAQIIADNPSFGLEDRNLLDKINYENDTIFVDGVDWPLVDNVFPTIDSANPYALTAQEQEVIDTLCEQFKSCEQLQRHIGFFIEHGSMYKIVDNKLLFHAAVPLNDDGTLRETTIFGQTLAGRALYDAIDGWVRDAFLATGPADKKRGMDLIWYLWLAPGSPLFAKSKMATLEAYLIADKSTHKEVKNAYYKLLDNPEVMARIFADFGVVACDSVAGAAQEPRALSGHTPVKVKDGENPIKCGGQALIIDGGFSGQYHKTTGIAGLCYYEDEEGAHLATCKKMPPAAQAIASNWDMFPEVQDL